MVVDKAPRGLSSRNPTTRWIEDARVMQMQGNQLRQVSLQQTESPMSGLEHSGEQGWRALAAGTHSSLSLPDQPSAPPESTVLAAKVLI